MVLEDVGLESFLLAEAIEGLAIVAANEAHIVLVVPFGGVLITQRCEGVDDDTG